MIDDRRTDHRLAAKQRARRRCDAPLLQIDDDPLGQFVGVGPRQCEADDVQSDGRAQREGRRLLQPIFQIFGEVAGAFDALGDLFRAEDAEGEPCLERAETARQVETEIARPYFARAEPARHAMQIGRRIVIGAPMRLGVAYEQEARVVGHVRPFVKVEGDGGGAFDAAHQRFQARRQRAQRAKRAVDVKPQAFGLTKIGQSREIVHGAGIHAAGSSYDEERLQSGVAVGGDLLGQQVDADRAARIDRDHPQEL